MNRFTIFHYHLLPGGVTNVILLGATALIRHYPDIKLLRLVCGNEENTDIIRSRIEKEADVTGLTGESFKFEICIDPEIGYRSFNGKITSEEVKALGSKLLRQYGDSFWWVHNYQLGKNPVFTAAVTDIARNNPKQLMLMHIHDFPECARYDNLEKLYSAGVKNPYPISDSAAYALINGRDEAILAEAGIPADNLFLLNNPVEKDSGPAIISDNESNKLKSDFYSFYKSRFPAVNPEGKMLFYPVRTIRRKNVFEAGLIASVSEQPVNLILSLPGVSLQEKKYSDLCEQSFLKGLIPGIWGSGTESSAAVPSYPQMLQLCDMIISSSVQEGFGYLFINSVQLGVPLFARDLDILKGITDVFPPAHSCFYDSFMVPCTTGSAELLKNRYHTKLKTLENYLSSTASEVISAIIEKLGIGNTIDYSFLPVEEQITILENAAESEIFRKEIHALNKNLMENFYIQLDRGRYSPDIDLNEFSLKTHSASVEKIINNLENKNRPGLQMDNDIQQNLLDRFAEPQYMRLLYDY
ncbi:MAG: hypothetical protein PQJ61_10680 [Spirochaetales bacterium]|uniref:Uncharacterized protein n=1 Tax=Candidatus Thalassospirochaeta sargassi TaxID=3119039 RepID=A0AAJ1IDB8_9SPIO|nr:hypothetical protein [Spirochaetales bacterium]